MMNNVYFCKDGILRVSHSFYNSESNKRKQIFVPVSEGCKDDPGYFLSLLNKDVILENDLTLRDFFENLKPFSSFISYMAHINFDEYYKEVLKDPDTSIDVSNISFLEVSHFIHLRNLENIGKEDVSQPYFDSGFDFLGVYKKEKKVKGTDLFDKKCSVMFLPMNNLASLPLKISQEIDVSGYDKDYKKLNFDLGSMSFFDFVVRGVLWEIGFFGPPENRDIVGDDLKRSVEEIKTEDCKTFDIDDFLEEMKNSPEPNVMSDEEFWSGLKTDVYVSEMDKNADEYFIDLLRSMDEKNKPLVRFDLKLN